MVSRKKIEEQEKQVRDLIIWAYGIETYREMMQLRADIRAKRERLIYRQRKRQQTMLDIAVCITGFMVCVGVIYTMFSIIQGAKG